MGLGGGVLLVVGCWLCLCWLCFLGVSQKRMTARDQTRRGSLPGSATALKSKWLVFRSDTNSGFVLQMPLFLVYECSLCRLGSSAATLSIPAMEYQ